MATLKKKNRFADRGAEAEKKTKDYLERWQERSVHREFNRLVDTKAAGRIIKAAVADFEIYCGGAESQPVFGLIEVKETKHDYRLERGKVTQLARLRKRAKCGGRCFVLVFHSEIEKWRVVEAPELMEFGDKGSWDLRGFETFGNPADALNSVMPYVFDVQEADIK